MNAAECPKCGALSKKKGKQPRTWWCKDCQMFFDDSDDGTIASGGDPASRLIRQEEEAHRNALYRLRKEQGKR